MDTKPDKYTQMAMEKLIPFTVRLYRTLSGDSGGRIGNDWLLHDFLMALIVEWIPITGAWFVGRWIGGLLL